MIHDPQARLDYTWDWTAWLGAGETILNVSIALAPEGVLTLIPPLEIDGGRVTVWLAGGTAGTDVKATLHVETTQGREDDRTITIRVRDR